jgi:uncharacterized membrane protein HdeD (DUF308 family)
MNDFSKTWGIWIVRGIASLAFGILTIAMPAASITALVLVFGAYAFVDGAVMLGLAFREQRGRGMYILRGLLGMTAGVIAFVAPGLTAVSLYILIGVWALSTGAMELAVAITLRREIPDLGWIGLTAVLALAVGVIMLALAFPLIGMTALVGVIAVYAIVNGIALIAIGRHVHQLLPSQPTHAAA